MTDITKCDNKKCKLKNDCYRFTAPNSLYCQSYFRNNPCKIKNGKFICNEFWDIKKKNINKSKYKSD